MISNVSYRGKTATEKDVEDIKRVIKKNPKIGRTKLSQELCALWDWRQPNGFLKDMVCRGFLLELEKNGYIKLPPRKSTPNNPFINRRKPAKVHIDNKPIKDKVSVLKPFRFMQVRNTNLEKTFNGLIEEHHYLGYCHPVGEQLKYLIYKGDRPVACFAWSSAPRHIGDRDRYIGWDQNLRKKNLHLMAYNSRFLILPWVDVPYLASHLLGEMTKRISSDWERLYKHPIYYLETFVDTELFKGTCYKAANWIYIGKTTGRGKNDLTMKQNRSIKSIYGFPLIKNFRQEMCNEQ